MKKFNLWGEGKYLDFWSINHFLSGVVLTGWGVFFGFSLKISFVVYVALAIGWEIFEIFKGIHEYFGNKVMDVVTGIIGSLLICVFYLTDNPISFLALICLTIVYILIEVWGYVSYKMR